MRIVIITADGRRHDYVTARLAAETDVVAVVKERKKHDDASSALAGEKSRVVAQHLGARDCAEQLMLDIPTPRRALDVLETHHGGANHRDAVAWIARHRPDLVVLYGSSIIDRPLLDAYRDRVVNLHLGLSPYYRGSATNFWPLVFGEPECVGATIHLAVPRVDAGPILAQVRPDALATDGAHEMGTRALMAGAAQLPSALSDYFEGNRTPQAQDLKVGRVFKSRDFTADAVQTMWHNLEHGMMADYIADMAARRGRFPIVEATTAHLTDHGAAKLA